MSPLCTAAAELSAYVNHLPQGDCKKAQYSVLYDICKKLISLKHCVRSQITRLKLQKSFCDLEHGASL